MNKLTETIIELSKIHSKVEKLRKSKVLRGLVGHAGINCEDDVEHTDDKQNG